MSPPFHRAKLRRASAGTNSPIRSRAASTRAPVGPARRLRGWLWVDADHLSPDGGCMVAHTAQREDTAEAICHAVTPGEETQVYPGVGRQSRHGRGEGDAAFSPPAAPAPPASPPLPIVFLGVPCREYQGNVPADVLKPPRGQQGD